MSGQTAAQIESLVNEEKPALVTTASRNSGSAASAVAVPEDPLSGRAYLLGISFDR